MVIQSMSMVCFFVSGCGKLPFQLLVSLPFTVLDHTSNIGPQLLLIQI